MYAFGFLGVSLNKGFEDFLSLARRLREGGSRATYSMVGTINHVPDAAPLRDILPDASLTPIDEGEYQRRAILLTYVVWTATPGDYVLRASATFVGRSRFREARDLSPQPLLSSTTSDYSVTSGICVTISKECSG